MKSAADTPQNLNNIPLQEYGDVVAKLSASQAQVEQLQHQLDWFKRQLFGRKSEKQLIDNPDQGALFALNKDDDLPLAPKKEIKAHTRSIKQKNVDDVNDTGLRFTDEVPTQVIDLPCSELDGDDADKYEVIGTKETCRLAQEIGSYKVIIYRRRTFREKGTNNIHEPKVPNNVLEGCYADVSLLAGLMVDKAVYHLPLHRQHQRIQNSGITLSRATLTNYASRGIDLLVPVVDAMVGNMIDGGHLSMDEVPMKAGRQRATGRKHNTMKQTYFWPIYGEQDEVAFTWSSTRSTQHAIEQLRGFNGTLLTDGYAAYTKTVNTLNQQGQHITHASCWAHCRRMFERALDSAQNEAQQAMKMIASLYDIEARIRKSTPNADDIVNARLKHSEPILNTFFMWVFEQRQRPELLPKSPLSKALAYAHERYHSLKIFLTHPQVQIDTNHLERALRVIPMGRKNHLFCWTELGAKQLGVLHSLTVTCKLHNINPYHYLVDVLQRVSQHPAKDVIDLTPRRWKVLFADKRLRSDVEHPIKTES